VTVRDAHRLVGLCERHGIAYRFNGRDPWHSSRWIVPTGPGSFVVWTAQGTRRDRSTYEDVRRRLVRAFDLPNTAR
jgi:hypothetical protein